MLGREWWTRLESRPAMDRSTVGWNAHWPWTEKNVCRDRWYIKLSCSGGSGNNNYHHISITRCKPNKKGKTFSRIPLAVHRLLLLVAFDAPCQNGIRFIVRPSLKIVKRQQHKHTRKKSKKEYPKTAAAYEFVMTSATKWTIKAKGRRNDFLPYDSRRPRLWEFVDFSADAPKRNKTLPFFFF